MLFSNQSKVNENMFFLQVINIFDEIFYYFLIKDIDYLLKNESIEKIFSMSSDLKMLNNGYIDDHSEKMWKLFRNYGYLMVNSLKIHN